MSKEAFKHRLLSDPTTLILNLLVPKMSIDSIDSSDDQTHLPINQQQYDHQTELNRIIDDRLSSKFKQKQLERVVESLNRLFCDFLNSDYLSNELKKNFTGTENDIEKIIEAIRIDFAKIALSKSSIYIVKSSYVYNHRELKPEITIPLLLRTIYLKIDYDQISRSFVLRYSI